MKYISLTLTALCLLAVTGCKAQTELKTKDIFIYRNGFAYVHNSGKVTVNNSKALITGDEFPKALFGSVWVKSSAGVSSLTRVNDTTSEAAIEPSLEQLLRNNQGLEISLTIETADDLSTIKGTVQQIYSEEKPGSGFSADAALAVIKTATGDVVITRKLMARVIYAAFTNTLKDNISNKTVKPALSVGLNQKSGSTDLDLVYLCRHPAWMPSYRLQLNGKKSSFGFSAELGSGNLNLNNTNVHLVDGSPEVYQGGISSLLSRSQAFEADYEADYDGAFEAVAFDYKARSKNETVETASSEDYYVHTVNDFTLNKNNSALININHTDVEPVHIYSCDLPAVNEFAGPGNQEPGFLYPVMHRVEFKNPFKYPLISAPVFVESEFEKGEHLLLGQPTVNSVSAGGLVRIDIAQNFDLPLIHDESEENRIPKAHTIKQGNTTIIFDKVIVSAVIQVENTAEKTMKMKVERGIQGAPVNSDAAWQVKKLRPVPGSPNGNNVVTWEYGLKAGEKKNIKYTYEYFLRVY